MSKIMSNNCPTVKIGPSILNADLSSLYEQCQMLMDSGADYLHLDVMDGQFVPNLTFGHPVVECLRPKLPNVMFDMHMMVVNPEKWITPMQKAGADQYTFHFESTNNVRECIRLIRESGMKVGMGIKPGTDAEKVLPYVNLVDMMLVMTVEPGFGGQSFMHNMMPKVRFLRDRYPSLDIEVDGGVSLTTIQECYEAGANMIVSGSAVVKNRDPAAVMTEMRQIASDISPFRKNDGQ